jgi:hypothetical protein
VDLALVMGLVQALEALLGCLLLGKMWVMVMAHAMGIELSDLKWVGGLVAKLLVPQL